MLADRTSRARIGAGSLDLTSFSDARSCGGRRGEDQRTAYNPMFGAHGKPLLQTHLLQTQMIVSPINDRRKLAFKVYALNLQKVSKDLFMATDGYAVFFLALCAFLAAFAMRFAALPALRCWA